jgi:F0F1-type ATP synthase membrane subunit c/vacuolar-type H+-ATPase subunit K
VGESRKIVKKKYKKHQHINIPNGLSNKAGEFQMNWPLIFIFGLVLPIIGAVIGAYLVHKKYTYLKEHADLLDMDETEFRRKNFGKYMVIQNLFGTGPVYGLLVIMLFWSFTTDMNIPEDMLSKLGLAVALAVGAPGLFSNIARGLISSSAFEAIAKDPKNFGRGIVHITMVETPQIYGLLIAILSMAFSGLFVGEYALSGHQAEDMFYSVVIFAIFSSGIILSGILLNKIKDPFSIKNFSKGVQLSIIGTVPPIIGLIYVIMKFIDIGIFV